MHFMHDPFLQFLHDAGYLVLELESAASMKFNFGISNEITEKNTNIEMNMR